MKTAKIFYYFINLNERGEFYADIRDDIDRTLIEIDTEYAEFLAEVQRVNLLNTTSVWNYFRSIGDLPSRSILVAGNKIS